MDFRDAEMLPLLGCTFAESNYEVPSIAVFEADGNWYRIDYVGMCS
jgi:hypothetical protein